MSIIKKIKEKILNLSDSYLFYKNYYQQHENLQDIYQKIEHIEHMLDSKYMGIDESLNYNFLKIDNNLNNKFEDIKLNQNIQNSRFLDSLEQKMSSHEKNYLKSHETYISELKNTIDKNNVINEKLHYELLKEVTYLQNKIKMDNKILQNTLNNNFKKIDVNQTSLENSISEKINDLNDSIQNTDKLNKDNMDDLITLLNNLENLIK